MNKQQISQRIQELMHERKDLEVSHYHLVQNHQKMSQEFQAAVGRNQSRFAQLAGGINELRRLLELPEGNHENTELNELLRITTPTTERT